MSKLIGFLITCSFIFPAISMGQKASSSILEVVIENRSILHDSLLRQENKHAYLVAVFSDHHLSKEAGVRVYYYENLAHLLLSCRIHEHRKEFMALLIRGCVDGSKWLRDKNMRNLFSVYQQSDFTESSINLLAIQKVFTEDEQKDLSDLYDLIMALPLPKEQTLIKDRFKLILAGKENLLMERNFKAAKAMARAGDDAAISLLLKFAQETLQEARRTEDRDAIQWIAEQIGFIPQRPLTEFVIDNYLFSDYEKDYGDYYESDFYLALSILGQVVAELSEKDTLARFFGQGHDETKAGLRQWFAENRDTYTYADWVKPRKKK